MSKLTAPKLTAWGAATIGGAVLLCLGAGYLWGAHTSDASGGGRQVATALVAPAAAVGATGTGSGTGVAVGAGITVTGSGAVRGTPDMLQLAIGVQVQAATVTAALTAADAKASAVQSSLRGHGVDSKDLQTSGLSVQPNYTVSGGRSVLNGYQVSESLTAGLRDLETAGAAISAAAAAGGDSTRIDSISLDLSDTGTLVSAARDRAFAQAKSKAEQYAKAAGVGLGTVLGIQETVATPASPAYAARASSDLAAVPIAAGSQQVSVDVTVEFAIG
jgi:uncharacterized protein YggE